MGIYVFFLKIAILMWTTTIASELDSTQIVQDETTLANNPINPTLDDTVEDDVLAKIVEEQANSIKKIISSNHNKPPINANGPLEATTQKLPLLPTKCLFHLHQDYQIPNAPDANPTKHENQKLQDITINNPPFKTGLYQEQPIVDINPDDEKTNRPFPILPSLTQLVKTGLTFQNIVPPQIQNLYKPYQPITEQTIQQQGINIPLPVLVQKTILPNGKTMYYTYRQLNSIAPTATSTTTTTTTTTVKPEPSSTIGNYGNNDHMETVSPPLQPGEPIYEQQMRFILPYPLPKSNHISSYPWEFDPYAYYPPMLRPSYMNMPAPYAPTYHMIRTLTLPNDTITNKLKTNLR